MGNFISKSINRTVQKAALQAQDPLRQQLAAFGQQLAAIEDRDARKAESLLAQFAALPVKGQHPRGIPFPGRVLRYQLGGQFVVEIGQAHRY